MFLALLHIIIKKIQGIIMWLQLPLMYMTHKAGFMTLLLHMKYITNLHIIVIIPKNQSR